MSRQSRHLLGLLVIDTPHLLSIRVLLQQLRTTNLWHVSSLSCCTFVHIQRVMDVQVFLVSIKIVAYFDGITHLEGRHVGRGGYNLNAL